eukprot:GHVU01060162.1.p1 GENE.GHVU01060162.1~~GHVU01060162.1.p1  ORF type:complete len:106 (+),score=1.83 GHVU01060162.1:157-474(+)
MQQERRTSNVFDADSVFMWLQYQFFLADAVSQSAPGDDAFAHRRANRRRSCCQCGRAALTRAERPQSTGKNRIVASSRPPSARIRADARAVTHSHTPPRTCVSVR